MPVVVFGMVPTDHSYCIKKQCDIKYNMYYQKGKKERILILKNTNVDWVYGQQ